jgi:molybdenum cofactor guanylyltransferase
MLKAPVSAIILSGGRATRMGGIDKGLVLLHQKPLITHVIDRLKPQVDELMINANRQIAEYKMFGYRTLQDEQPDFIGPLAGFSLGLQFAQHAYVLTVPCDSPFLPNDLVERLLNKLLEENAEIAVAKSNGDTHPVFSLSSKSVLPSLQDYLGHGGRKVSTWQKSLRYVEVDFSDCNGAFLNINTLETLNDLASTS